MLSVNEWLKTIEMKKFVDDGMFLQMKITLGERHENPNQVSSHEETQHDGPAQSVVNEVTPRERSSVGSWKRSKATTIYHWKRWSRIRIVSGIQIILEQGEWSGAKKTETNFKMLQKTGEKHSDDLGNVHDCNNGISSIHGKELPEQSSIHREHNRSHTQTNVRHIYKIGVWARWDLWIGNNWLGESFMEISCPWLVTKESSIFSARRSTSFRILCCALGRFSKTPNRTMHGNKDWDG